MRILLTLLLLSAPSLAVPPRHRSFRELVAERGLVVSEACLADTQTLRQNEALATALANSQAEASNAIMNSCQANGNNLICQADIGTLPHPSCECCELLHSLRSVPRTNLLRPHRGFGGYFG